MAFDAGTVKGKLELDAAAFLAAMTKAEKRLDAIEKESRKASESFTKLGNTVKGVFLGLAASAGAVLGLRAIKGGLESAAAEAADSEQRVRDLTTALEKAGTQDIPTATAELLKFADAVQASTKFSNDTVTSLSSLAVNLGFTGDRIQEVVRAALDLQTAVGIDAQSAVKNLARAQSGLLGELGEQLPILRSLTAEQLKAGEAVDLVLQRFGGSAAASVDTFAGRLEQLNNAWGDFRQAIGDAVLPILQQFTGFLATNVQAALDGLKNNAIGLEQVFRQVAGFLADFLSGSLELFAGATNRFADFLVGIKLVVPAVQTALATLDVAIRGAIESFLAYLADLPLVGKAFEAALEQAEAALKGAEVNAANLRKQLDAAHAAAEQSVAPLRSLAKFADVAGDKAFQFANQVRQASEAAQSTAKAVAAVSENTDTATTYAERLAARLEHVRQQTGIAATEMGKFANQAEKAGSALQRSGAALASAAGAAGAATGGGATQRSSGGDSFLEGFGRRQGGSAGLDLNSVVDLEAAIAAARAASAGTTNLAARKSLGITTANLQARLAAVLKEDRVAFTSQIMDELNRRGIFTPEQRARIVEERIQEAQRLGVLSKPSSLLSGYVV